MINNSEGVWALWVRGSGRRAPHTEGRRREAVGTGAGQGQGSECRGDEASKLSGNRHTRGWMSRGPAE